MKKVLSLPACGFNTLCFFVIFFKMQNILQILPANSRCSEEWPIHIINATLKYINPRCILCCISDVLLLLWGGCSCAFADRHVALDHGYLSGHLDGKCLIRLFHVV